MNNKNNSKNNNRLGLARTRSFFINYIVTVKTFLKRCLAHMKRSFFGLIKSEKTIAAFFVLFLSVILFLSIRGNLGTPTSQELNETRWHSDGPFELSPERGRFALLYSIIEDGSFIFSVPVARFATPDLGFENGKYVSLFAPAVSFIVAPGYVVGKALSAGQVGAFLVISTFAVINAFLVSIIVRLIGGKRPASYISGIIFLFATPAFAYATTLYQHHISTFLILTSLYIVLKHRGFIATAIVWLLFAASIPVDYPNLVLMLPIALYAFGRIIWAQYSEGAFKINLNLLYMLSLPVMVLPLMFYAWFSYESYGKPFQLSGTVERIQALDAKGRPAEATKLEEAPIAVVEREEGEKTATGFFKTRNLLNGLYIHILSPDRGILYFTPIMFFGILGAFVLWSKKQTELSLIVGIIVSTLTLYSLWGDPWGGWAFGSRYLVPAYAMLSILIGIGISKYFKKWIVFVPFLVIGMYSIAVNTAGALSSIANPPQIQVLMLEQQTGSVQKYTVERNFDYLVNEGTKSFFYNTFLNSAVSSMVYFWIIALAIVAVAALFVIRLRFTKYE